MISFNDAIRETNEPRVLLLGNGFSKNFCRKFDYTELFEVAKDNKKLNNDFLSEELTNVFNNLETHDFEKVIAHLNIAEKIIDSYAHQELKSQISNDLKKIRRSFIRSIIFIHPEKPDLLEANDFSHACTLFSNFEKIFTTNYDVILYWIIMEAMEARSPIKIPHNDGFGKRNGCAIPLWIHCDKQKIFFLHGGLHLFFEGENVFKIQRNKNQHSSLLQEIKKKIENGSNPLLVLEGKSKQKLEKINSNPYLWHSYESFKKIKGTLFIIGSSLNKYSDNHILEAIKDNNEINKIYIGIYSEDKEGMNSEQNKFLKEFLREKVEFFDAKTILSFEKKLQYVPKIIDTQTVC